MASGDYFIRMNSLVN